MLPNPDPYPQFEFLQFNPVRAFRGKEAAWVKVTVERDATIYLWMNVEYIQANITNHGRHPQLLRALDVYRIGKRFPEKTV